MQKSKQKHIVLGLVLGCLLGLILNTQKGLVGVGVLQDLVDFIGSSFLRLLRMLVLPLIISSIIVSLAKISELSTIGRLGVKTLVFYFVSSLVAACIGITLVNVFQPGVGIELELVKNDAFDVHKPQPFLTILAKVIPSNPIAALVEFNVIAIIFYSVFFGFCLHLVQERYRQSMLGFFEAIYEITMKMVEIVIKFIPIGVFALIASVVAKGGTSTFKPLLSYIVVVAVGLALHALAVLPFFLKLLSKQSPYHYMRAMSPALLMAFSTASSSATLPVTINCAQRRAGISDRTAGFVLPLGATINMDGTALYECVAVIFVSQILGYDLSIAQQFVIVITALMVSVGAAGIPYAGIVMMTLIVQAVGLPLEAIGIVAAVDTLVGMLRTVVNVWSDSVGTYIIANSEGDVTQPSETL